MRMLHVQDVRAKYRDPRSEDERRRGREVANLFESRGESSPLKAPRWVTVREPCVRLLGASFHFVLELPAGETPDRTSSLTKTLGDVRDVVARHGVRVSPLQ